MDGVLTRGLITAALFIQVFSSGMFEIALLSVYNGYGKRLDGHCCVGSGDSCDGECRTFVTACLLPQTESVPDSPDCVFGNTSSSVLGGNSINSAEVQRIAILNITFVFSWPALFTLVVDARHDKDHHLSVSDPSQIILHSIVSNTLYPPSLWYTETKTADDKAIQYEYRVICDENYFGAGCEVFCRPRNDSFGHYVCDADGSKLCLPGWQGEFCQTAMCWDKCNMSHGFCNEPFQCSCMIGWEGESCDQCTKHPDCVNGYCQEPWQCICQGDWTGINCNVDINYCYKYDPCEHGGVCISDLENFTCFVDINYCYKYDPCEHGGVCISDLEKNFTCQCLPDFTGINCESIVCFDGFCQNGGNCSNSSVGCECPEKYYGPHCEYRKLTCPETDCMNGGICIPTPTGTLCNCSAGYTGENCKSEIDECHSNPCQYGGVCADGINEYICSCREGYMGNNCEIVMNPCMGITCFHGGTCVPSSSGDSGICVCKHGNTGYRCEIVLDPCSNIECQNGGECTNVDTGFGFQCICKSGFNGVHCEIQADHCQNIDCANGGTCKSYTDHYECICDPHYGGKHCKTLLMPSDQTVSNSPPDETTPVVKEGANSSYKLSYRAVYILLTLIIVIKIFMYNMSMC